jgi:hypothetical protein
MSAAGTTPRQLYSPRQRVLVLTFVDAEAADDWEQLGGPFSIPDRWHVDPEGADDPNGCDVRGCTGLASTHRSGEVCDLILCADHDHAAAARPTDWRMMPSARLDRRRSLT